jgi:hypothetical protein
MLELESMKMNESKYYYVEVLQGEFHIVDSTDKLWGNSYSGIPQNAPAPAVITSMVNIIRGNFRGIVTWDISGE